MTRPGDTDDMAVQGQCLLCGGRGGWWSEDFRESCRRCDGTGWDPSRYAPWFPNLSTVTGQDGAA